jgi:hypothetical protein
MHIKAKPPVLVPPPLRFEIETYSKAMLMDMVWHLSRTDKIDDDATMKTIRDTAEVVSMYRKRAAQVS